MRSENKQTFKPNLTSTPSYSLSPCKMSVSLAEPLMSKHDYERWSSNLSIGDSHDDIDSKSYYIKLNSSTGCAISKALARKSMLWAKDSLERLPIKLTLENVGVITVFVALIMPKALTYALIYPIFRLVFGTLYPAYASYKAVRTKNVKEYVKWMMYWIVFALFTCAETFTDVFFSFWFPFYYEIKIILVLWLLSPATKGSSILYRRFVHPALCRREAEIDDALARATEQGYSAVLQLGTKGVNYATTVLMQTAIKGGGGLVQQLRKSYSLSDLTGEKEDENRNTEESPDEVDLEEPRRRETRGRRGYSPRRTQSSSNRMEMYFSEVDVEVRQSRSKEPVGSLTNIKSSEDISSGYSSGEALHSQRSSIASEQHLVRTASVGARNRTKPRSTTKKSPEVEQVEEEAELIESNEQLFPFNLLPKLTPTQALELISFFSKHKEQINTIHQQNFSDSDDEDSSTLKDLSCEKKEEPKSINSVIDDKTKEENKMETVLSSVVDVRIEEEKPEKQLELNKMIIDTSKINTDLCSDKLDELKELLNTANQTVATIVSSQENISQTDSSSSDSGLTVIERDSNLLEIKSSPNISRSNSDYNISERAGKYHKKPAPKAPESDIPKEDEDEEEEKPLKATLVIKTGLVKSFTNSEEPVKRRKKTNAKTAARESFNKLLTIPKNIFHNAFHKDKDEDGKSICSDKSSRSGSYEKIDVTNILLNKKDEGDTYISLRSDSLDCDTEKESKVQDNTKETIQKEETLV